MRKWKTNVHSLQDRFKERVSDESTSCKVLVYCSNSADDILNIDSDKLLKNKGLTELKFTKRCVMKTIERIYDPLGSISVSAVRAEMLLQDIWEKKLDWDDALLPDLAKIFQD